MTFREARLTLQLLAEVGYGASVRLDAYAKRAQEDAAFAQLKKAVDAR